MLQKVMCGYTTAISKFKSNPSAALAEAREMLLLFHLTIRSSSTRFLLRFLRK